ncbi:TPA: hypothetical protein ACXJEC_004751 [Serratia marcescens]|uniref:relaxosome protein TraM n=1 Tax=Serratia ureilytica TaxID=300181 RepID=UPI00313E5978
MADIEKKSNNRVYLTIPYSWMEKVDQQVQMRLDDGETRDTANRAAYVMEMFKLGMRVEENKKNKDEGQKSLDEKLHMLSKNVLISSFFTEALYFVMKEVVDREKVVKTEQFLSDDFITMVNERVAGKLAEFFK